MPPRSQKTQKKRKPTRYRDPARLSFSRKLHFMVRRFLQLLLIGTILSVAGLTSWMGYSGTLIPLLSHAKYRTLVWTAQFGFILENVHIEGQQHLPTDEAIAALNITQKTPIFAISLKTVKDNLESLGWVKHADVQRVLPDTLRIKITERTPFALWQLNKRLRLIDWEGNIIADEGISEFKNLPILVGADAHLQVSALFSFLSQEPDLMKEVDAVIRVGGRRWDIRFKNGIEVKLPEQAPDVAWKRLSEMNRSEQVLRRAIKTIDLRIPDRVFFEVDG